MNGAKPIVKKKVEDDVKGFALGKYGVTTMDDTGRTKIRNDKIVEAQTKKLVANSEK